MKTVILKVDAKLKEKSEREGRTILQKEVADVTKIPQGTVSRYMKGNLRRVDFDVLEKLCDYFQCAPGDLIGFEES